MSFASIVAPARDAVTSDAAQLAAEVEGYAAFRSIIDAYPEPPRPSLVDVEGAALILRDACAASLGQNVPQRVRSGSLAAATAEGRTFRLSVAPGVIAARTVDVNRTHRTLDAAQTLRQALWTADGDSPAILAASPEELDEVEDRPSRAEIVRWSAKSRAMLTRTIPALDFSDWDQSTGALAMVTLTLPDRWQEVAPTGREFKRKLEAFRKRFVRDSGQKWRILWKLEFQRRGAPHWHALMRVPVLVKGVPFEAWLARTWADVVDASKIPDREDGSSEYSRNLSAGTGVDFSGQDFSDPRRIAMYFLGHSSKTTDGKEYQHIVPDEWKAPGAGPGRFWGYCGFTKAVVEIDVDVEDYQAAQRVLRKVRRAAAWKTAVRRAEGACRREHLPFGGVRSDGGKYRGAFDVEAPGPKKRLGRAARRTLARNRAANTELVAPGKVVEVRQGVRQFVQLEGPAQLVASPLPPVSSYAPSGLGARGGYSGGFLVVNDGLALAFDLARYLATR